jgi:hypothetical protein
MVLFPASVGKFGENAGKNEGKMLSLIFAHGKRILKGIF